MGLFGKKKTEKVEVSSLVKILGSGCAKCNTLEDNTVEALKMLGKEMPVEHVTDFSKIAAYGVMTTPALVYDQKVLIAGAHYVLYALCDFVRIPQTAVFGP